MCRYAAYLGSPLLLSELIYKPANSLVHQATDATLSPTRVNADGFGVGWYAPEISPEPAVFKDVTPVWNNYNLGEIAGKIRSPSIVVHIRAARSYDPVSRENCHPFRRGRLLWMHNGDIPGRVRLARQVNLLADDGLMGMIRGTTDSELAFTLFLTQLGAPPEDEVSLAQLSQAMDETVRRIAGWHREVDDTRPVELNFCVTDGVRLVATRFALTDGVRPTLYWRVFDGDTGERSVLVASEPLSKRNGWNAVGEGRLLQVGSSHEVEERSLAVQDDDRLKPVGGFNPSPTG